MELRVGNRYRLRHKIGSGSFGDIYLGSEVGSNLEVAIKLESIRSRHPQLLYESKLYKILEGGVGIPHLYWFGVEGDYNVMVVDHLERDKGVKRAKAITYGSGPDVWLRAVISIAPVSRILFV